jgi:DNA ligase (NAD+)
MEICKINKSTGRCSLKGTINPELCEMSSKNRCKRKTLKKNKSNNKSKTRKVNKKHISKSNSKLNNNPNIMDLIQRYRREGVAFLDTLNKSDIESILITTNDAYRNKKPIITDNEYDTIENYARQKYPNMSYLNKVGADVNVNKKKVKLPYFMASMDKIKNDPRVLTRFINKYTGPYVISDKLDGISGMYYCQEGKEPKLFTRGNGSIGQDITYLLPYIKGVPKNKICNQDLVVRGELIVPKRDYEQYKNKYSNSRIMVSSIANSKNFSAKEASKIHFVAYEQIIPDVKPSEQMRSINEHPGFEVVYNTIIQSGDLNSEILSDLLVERRRESKYDIDGIIVLNDKKYSRKDKNPEHGFAFKMLLKDQQAETIVIGVEWNASKDGYLKPRVRVETTHIGGTKINYVTGYHARFIVDNNIGVGARVLLVRSGDVIPKIVQVIEPAQVVGMPPDGTYEWNETNIDIRIIDGSKKNDNVEKKKILFFFNILGTEYMRAGNINKLYNAGYKTIKNYVHLRVSDVEKLEGFGNKGAQKLKDAIDKSLREASFVDLMAASNTLGRGFSKKRLQSIVDEYPDAFNLKIPLQERKSELLNISGLSDKTVNQFLRNLPKYYEFIEENDLPKHKLSEIVNKKGKQNKSNKDGKMSGIKVLFTGFRDKRLEELVVENGGEIVSSVTKNLSVLIAKDKNKMSTKMKKAIDLGIPVLTREEFISQFSL